MKKVLSASAEEGFNLPTNTKLGRVVLLVESGSDGARQHHHITFKVGADAKGVAQLLRELADKLEAD